MATKTTTGIRLTQFHRTGGYVLNRPGRDSAAFDAGTEFADVATASGLANGYWLREHNESDRTTWTWVQL